MIALSSARVRRVAALGAALGVASCTLLGSREIVQCNADGDCAESPLTQAGPAECIAHLCATRVTPLPDAGPPLEGGDGDAAVDAPPMGCKKSADCSDQAQICASGTCKTLVTDDKGPCPLLANNGVLNSYREDGALIVGVYVYDPRSLGAEVKAAEAALQKINEVLPKANHISAVFCSKADKFAKASGQAAINHLDSLGVPLVVGQFEATELVALDAKRLAVWSTLGNVPSLQQAGGGSKVRLLVDELQKLTPGYTAALAEAAVRADKIHATTYGNTVKITLVTNGQIESTLLVDQLEANEPLLQAGQSSYARSPIELKPDFETVGVPANLAVAQAVIGALPQIIIAVGGDEVSTLMTYVEGPQGWPAASKRPVWVLSTRGKFTAQALSTLAATGTLRTRVIGVDFAGDRTNQLAYRASIPAGVPQAGSFDNIYDAMFATAFAAGRASFNRGDAGAGSLDAAELVRGLDEVLEPSGTGDVTMNAVGQLAPTASAVGTGKTVFFTGTTGPWLFPDGSRRMGTSYYCFRGPELNYYVDSAGIADVLLCQRP